MITPQRNDVVFGKGYSIQRRPGNQHYHWLVETVKPVYDQVPKNVKRLQAEVVVHEIVEKLDPPGRFLKKNQESGFYELVDREMAVQKARQALRDWKPKKHTNLRRLMQKNSSVSITPSAFTGTRFQDAIDEHEVLKGRSRRMQGELDERTISANNLIHPRHSSDDDGDSMGCPSSPNVKSTRNICKSVLNEYATDPYNIENARSTSMRNMSLNEHDNNRQVARTTNSLILNAGNSPFERGKCRNPTNRCSKLMTLLRVMEERCR